MLTVWMINYPANIKWPSISNSLEDKGTVTCAHTISISPLDSRAQSAFAADGSGDGKAEDYKPIQNSIYTFKRLLIKLGDNNNES